jgi:hypothetical protein
MIVDSRLSRAKHSIFGFPDLVRFSWATTKEILTKEGELDVKW